MPNQGFGGDFILLKVCKTSDCEHDVWLLLGLVVAYNLYLKKFNLNLFESYEINPVFREPANI